MSGSRWRSFASVVAVLAGVVVIGGAPASAESAAARPPEVLKAALDELAGEGKAGRAQFWYVDQEVGKVSISVLDGPPDPVTRAFLATAFPGEAVVSTVAVPVEPMVGRIPAGRVKAHAPAGGTLYAGESIEMTWGDTGSVCTSGFNRTDGDGQQVTLTAGHCGNGVVGNGWHLTGGDTFGYVKESHFPESDWSSIRPATDSTWSFPSAVKQAGGLPLQPISGFGSATVGMNLCMTGQTSGTTCGKVTATGVTVNYRRGVVYGTVKTTVPAAAGDSGGPVYSGSTGVGLLSGGPESGGSPTFVYPVG